MERFSTSNNDGYLTPPIHEDSRIPDDYILKANKVKNGFSADLDQHRQIANSVPPAKILGERVLDEQDVELYGYRLDCWNDEAVKNRAKAWCPFMDAGCDLGAINIFQR